MHKQVNALILVVGAVYGNCQFAIAGIGYSHYIALGGNLGDIFCNRGFVSNFYNCFIGIAGSWTKYKTSHPKF